MPTRTCCGDPLRAAIDYLTATTPLTGACNMFTADHRFHRFREWINSIGGSVSNKVSFRRGYFVDPLSKRLAFSVGGLFLNPNEVLVQGETIFSIPHQAIFHDRMIVEYVPGLPHFEHGGSSMLWFAMGLAALLKHRPDIVGPWSALLPDMSYQPQLWSGPDFDHLVGSPAHSIVESFRAYLDNGCHAFATNLDELDITCADVKEANAIIASRSFGLEVFPGDERSAIPFGPDLLNHNPNTHSWISAVRSSDGTHVDCLFFMQSYTLSASRELFNNYGPHALSANMATYGFTSPNVKDELVFIATTDDFFDGKRFPIMSVCPSSTSLDAALPLTSPECPAEWPSDLSDFDDAGYFRLVDRDVITFFPTDDFSCNNQIDGPMWGHIAKELALKNVHIKGDEFVLRLNVIDGAEPQLNHQSLAWMSLCGLPSVMPEFLVAQFITELTTCKPQRNTRYFEEFPVNPLVRNLAKETLSKACKEYQEFVIGDLEFNMLHWLAFRNAKRLKINKYENTWYHDISGRIPSTSTQAFKRLAELIISSNDVIYGDNDGPLNHLTDTFVKKSLTYVDRMEEVYKYRMQIAYMLIRKCVQPLDRVLRSPNFRTLVTDL